jgi:hypothetical protein
MFTLRLSEAVSVLILSACMVWTGTTLLFYFYQPSNQKKLMSSVLVTLISLFTGPVASLWILPYFPVDNVRVIYTKKYIKRKKPMVCVIYKVRIMQLKSKKFQIIYIPMYKII